MLVASSYWGGQYNPLIPVLGSDPQWAADPLPSPTADEVVRGYLDVWEPDVTVNAVTRDGGPRLPPDAVDLAALWRGGGA